MMGCRRDTRSQHMCHVANAKLLPVLERVQNPKTRAVGEGREEHARLFDLIVDGDG